MQFGDRLKQKRKIKELTQDEVAEKLNVSRQTISSWENEKSYPDIKSLIALSNIYDISLDTMLKEDSGMKEFIEKNDVRKNLIGLICTAYSFDIFIMFLYGIIITNPSVIGINKFILSWIALFVVMIVSLINKFLNKIGFKNFDLFGELFHLNYKWSNIISIFFIAILTIAVFTQHLIIAFFLIVILEIAIVVYYLKNK